MKLIQLAYLVFSLGNRVMKLCIEIGLTNLHILKQFTHQLKIIIGLGVTGYGCLCPASWLPARRDFKSCCVF
jgi:hypothetical protein